jgi:hypothetical protein
VAVLDGEQKDYNAPAKPLSPFFVFLRAVRDDPKRRVEVFQGETSIARQSKLAADVWKTLPATEKTVSLSASLIMRLLTRELTCLPHVKCRSTTARPHRCATPTESRWPSAFKRFLLSTACRSRTDTQINRPPAPDQVRGDDPQRRNLKRLPPPPDPQHSTHSFISPASSITSPQTIASLAGRPAQPYLPRMIPPPAAPIPCTPCPSPVKR